MNITKQAAMGRLGDINYFVRGVYSVVSSSAREASPVDGHYEHAFKERLKIEHLQTFR